MAPAVAEREHISLRDLAKLVPTGVVSCLLVGMAHGALTGMAAIYATRVGLSPVAGRLVRRRPEHRRHVAALAGVGGVRRHRSPRRRARRVARRDRRGHAVVARSVDQSDGVAADGAARRMQLPAVLDRRRLHERLDRPGARQRRGLAVGHAVRHRRDGRPVRCCRHDDRHRTRRVTSGRRSILHAMLAAFFLYRMRAWRAPLAKRPWSEVSLPARAFFVPATVVAMGRRYRDKVTG